MIAALEIAISFAGSPPEILCCTLSIRLAEIVAKMIHPIDPRIMVHTAISSASGVSVSAPSCTPTDAVPKPAAIDSNITEPIRESLIHAIGPPTVIRRESIPLKITIDGPMEVIALLLIAFFICFSVSPIFFPAE